ncbi:MAG: sodium-dependent transporter [Bacteroidales bacterium]|nr:sodium-dependent transporter [Bacteroidales bacterium]
MAEKSRGFTSYIGAVLAAAGGAVGLGNIWRFPYMLGQNGGGAFLLVYIFFVLFIGIPLMMTEFIIGRRGQSNVVGSYRNLSKGNKGWITLGIFSIVCALMIYAFYSVVAGWTLNYLVLACRNQLSGLSTEEVSQTFNTFTQGSFYPILFQFLFIAITGGVIAMGVQKGIEKVSKILIPILFILLFLMCVRSLSLKGASEGLKFVFNPDFSKITGKSLLDALGQSFFSLSLGMGAMITYGSYIRKGDNLFKSSLWVAICDLGVAILAGIVIFPAVFAFGMNPADGPKLVYIVLPNVFNSMPAGNWFAIIFFVLLCIATLTSTMSLLEILVSTAVEELHWKRGTASILASILVFGLGIFCTLSFGPLKDVTIGSKTIFDIFDLITASYLMPIGALLMTIFLGWCYPKTEVRAELSNDGKRKVRAFEIYYFILRYVAPIALIVILISGFFK